MKRNDPVQSADVAPEERGGGGGTSPGHVARVDETRVASPRGMPALSWPPPGLSRIQGDIYAVSRWLAAGAFLILPLLWAVVAEQSPWELGPLGNAIWVAFVLGIVGIPILLSGHLMLSRLLGRGMQAAREGYGWRLIVQVAADHRRDAGFLLQGVRAYSPLKPATRRRLAGVRILTALLILGAAFWLSVGFAIAVVVAARGFLPPPAVAGVTLIPSAGMLLGGAVLYSWEEGVLRRARKTWHGRSWTAELARTDIRSWQDALEARHPESADRSDPKRWARTFRVARVIAGVLALVGFIPVFVLIFSSTISPIMARVALPKVGMTQERMAQLEPFRRFVLEPDGSITAAEAGSLLNALSYVGSRVPDVEGMNPPAVHHPEPWFPRDDATPEGARLQPTAWTVALTERGGLSLSPEETAYLERVAAHPGHALWSRLARADAADVVAGRYRTPFPEDMSMATLPLPRFGSIREGSMAHVARGVLEASRGQIEAAETTIREAMSVGFLLADQGPMLIDNLVGIVIAGNAANALENVYDAVGRTAQAEAMRRDGRVGERTAEQARIGETSDVNTLLQAMPEVALNPAALRGLRWEYTVLVNTVGPCINLRQIVFGPGEEYRLWLDNVETSLVRSPAEAELFELARAGYFGGSADASPNLLTRIATLTMGGSDRPGSCGRAMNQIVSSF